MEKDARQDGAMAGLRRMMEIQMWLLQGSAIAKGMPRRPHVLQVFFVVLAVLITRRHHGQTRIHPGRQGHGNA